ncbi:hypothetical protein [Myxosarcina sp. GI1(2024)]
MLLAIFAILINTYAGNPASTALSLKNIEILETDLLTSVFFL